MATHIQPHYQSLGTDYNQACRQRRAPPVKPFPCAESQPHSPRLTWWLPRRPRAASLTVTQVWHLTVSHQKCTLTYKYWPTALPVLHRLILKGLTSKRLFSVQKPQEADRTNQVQRLLHLLTIRGVTVDKAQCFKAMKTNFDFKNSLFYLLISSHSQTQSTSWDIFCAGRHATKRLTKQTSIG